MKRIILFFIIFQIKTIVAQDVHYSQNFVDRMHLNPALIGSFNETDFRFSIQRKSQWASIGVPFSTFSSSFEQKKIYKYFNYGIQFLHDNSGEGSLSLDQISLGLSSSYPITKNQILSFGSMISIAQKNLDHESLVFIDPESIASSNFIYPDINVGGAFQINYNSRYMYIVGVSLYHLNKPKNSFNNDLQSYLPIKKNIHFNIKYRHTEKMNLKSEAIFTNQSSQSEIIIGIRPEINIDNLLASPLIYYRSNDAVILGLGLQKRNLLVNVTYDINTSDLMPASNKKGGFEFSIIYIWNKKYNPPKKEICPKYL